MKELKPQLIYLAFKGFFYDTFTKKPSQENEKVKLK